MSHESRAASVTVILERSETEELECRVFSRHGELHSDACDQLAVLKVSCILEVLYSLNDTVRIYIIRHAYLHEILDRSESHAYSIAAVSLLHRE